MLSKNSEAQKCANTLGLLSNKSREGNIDVNIVAKSDLNFHGMNLAPVQNVNGIWLTSADVAKALGYKSTKSISNLFAQYEDEFSSGMTMVIESVTNGINGSSRRMKVRVFSLRGAHLIAMFARTPVAKEFRRWVLDILDREVEHSPIAKQFTDDEILDLCYLQFWMEKSQHISKLLYPAMKQAKSEYAGVLKEIAHDVRYMTDRSKQILLREAQGLDGNSFSVQRAMSILAELRGDEGLIH